MMNEEAKKILTSIAVETLERLAFIFSSAEEENDGLISEMKAADVSFSGPFSGKLVMKMSTPAVLEMTANMLGIDENKATNEQQSDAMKEALNVICGNLLPAIGGSHVIFNISVPQITAEEPGEEIAKENQDSKSLAVTRLSIDGELCEFYLFVEGNISL